MLLPKPEIIGLCSPSMGSGKTTTALILDHDWGYVRVRFADTLKAMVRELLVAAQIPYRDIQRHIDGDLKEVPLAVLGGKTPRQAMQTLGTEWGRKMVQTNLWVDITMARVDALLKEGECVVIDDMRFPNEADAIRNRAGWLVGVQREEAKITSVHESEGALEGFKLHKVLQNYGDIDDLEYSVTRWMRHFRHDLKHI